MNASTVGVGPTALSFLFRFLVCRLFFARLAAGFEAAYLVIGDCVVGFERPDGGSLSRQPKFRPTRGNLIVDLLAQRGALGKDRKVAVPFAGVGQSTPAGAAPVR